MFEFSKKSYELQEKLKVFMHKYVYTNEDNITKEINSGNIWEPSSIIEELKHNDINFNEDIELLKRLIDS